MTAFFLFVENALTESDFFLFGRNRIRPMQNKTAIENSTKFQKIIARCLFNIEPNSKTRTCSNAKLKYYFVAFYRTVLYILQ